MSTLTPPLFAILSSLVGDRLGLHYSDDDAPVFSEKVMARARQAGFESALDYYYFLRYDETSESELQHLADALVVPETYLFREMASLRAGIATVIRPAIERRGEARIWSAACASGEEPLTLAMMLHRAGLIDRCSILATDLSQRSLARARAGVYGGRSLRVLDGPNVDADVMAMAADWTRREDGRVLVDKAIQERIDYRRVNLIEPNAVRELGMFDLVLCRNVMIYFSEETTRQLLDSLYEVLRPAGKLIVGSSESLLRFGTRFECQEHGGAFLYAKNA